MKKEDLIKTIGEKYDSILIKLADTSKYTAEEVKIMRRSADIYKEMINSISMIDTDMNKDVAITILQNHNAWRRDQAIPNTNVLVDPATLGQAIDYAIEYMKEH